MRFIFMSFLALAGLFAAGCAKQSVITKTQIIPQKVPANLLTLRKLQKPVVRDDMDIINAYSDLFLHYKECEINIEKIRSVNER